MISLRRHGMLGRRLWPIALSGAVLAVAAVGPSTVLAASPDQHQRGDAQTAQQPQQVIDAQTDPQAAGTALDAGTCDDCIKWQTDTAPGGCKGAQPPPPAQPAPGGTGCVPTANNTRHYAITEGFGPPAIFGDVLYNCGDDEPAETDVGVSDERKETTSLTETVSLKISVKLIDIGGASAEFSAFSKQANSSATSVEVDSAVAVDPGWKGWTVVQVKTATIPGSAYITDPLRGTLTAVQNIALTFPGYRLNPNEVQTSYTGLKIPMTADEKSRICDADPVGPAMRGFRVVGSGLTVRKPSRFALRLCGRPGRCASREVTGTLPPSRIRRATARLTRSGRIYGRGTYTRGRTKLRMRRALPPGSYRLTLRTPSQRVGGSVHANETILPITVS